MRFGLIDLAILAGLTIAAAQGQKTTWDKIYTSEQAVRGEKLYAENCAGCHGDGLGGVEMAPALTGDMFYANWEGVPLSDLLERAQNADILAHILRVGGFPAGDVPLDGQVAALAQIKFLTYKPQ
jgi:mono/diheme cytochrome c family protein